MKLSIKTAGRILGVAVLLGGGLTFAQNKDEKKPASETSSTKSSDAKPAPKADDRPTTQADKSGGQSGSDAMAKMMEMVKSAAPGEQHTALKPMAGAWTFTTKARMADNQQWSISSGKADYKWILGGRILTQEVKTNPTANDAMMGGPFEAFGMIGYDNLQKKFFNVWTDTLGTGYMTSEGTADESKTTITLMGEHHSPMTGKKEPRRSVIKIVDDNKFVFDMHSTGPDGKEFHSLEVVYQRQK